MDGIERLEQTLLSLDRRIGALPLFLRVIGLDTQDRTLALLQRFETQAGTRGAVLRGGLANPTEPETERFFAAVGNTFLLARELIPRHLTVWLGQLRPAQREPVSAALWTTLDLLRAQGANESILKNAYIKFMCWLHTPFGRILSSLGGQLPPKVMFEGDIGKYELLFLRLLHTAGCDVVYVHYTSSASYDKYDSQGRYSMLVAGAVLAAPTVHPAPPRTTPSSKPAAPTRPAPSVRPRPSPAPRPLPQAPWQGMSDTVELNTWVGNTPMWEAVLQDNVHRDDGPHLMLRAVFAACFGADERGTYRNRLFGLKRALDGSGKKWLLLEGPLPAPGTEEAALFRTVDKTISRPALIRDLAVRVSPVCGRVQALLAQRAFSDAMEQNPEQDVVRLYNHGVRLACWVKRYVERLFEGYRAEKQPVVVFYGPIKEAEISLLWVLAQTGVDVLYFSPDATLRSAFSTHSLSHIWAEVLFDGTLPHEPFPEREERLRASTTAYNASRELDQLLYSDTGMFRDRQFARSQPVTLKTTFDEVGQLWKEESQFRPSFETKGGVVYVPNLFAKVCGVDKGDLTLYWDNLRAMVTQNTWLITAIPFLGTNRLHMTPAQAKRFLHDGKLDPKALKASEFYQYDYLPDDTQDYILEKIQALIDYDLIINGGEDLGCSMLSVLIDLDKELLRLIQNFDFPHEVPKVLIVDVTETVFTLEECILLAFVNLVGFDTAVFTPTGYRNLEKYLRPDSFDTLTAGDYCFDLTIPDLRKGGGKAGGDWLSRFFGGGRTQ